jgi:SAM-dependent methyltransferase
VRLGRRDNYPHHIPLPPQELMFETGAVDEHAYRAAGKNFRQHFTKLCGLRRGDDVLEVGCGCARIAMPLIPYLRRGTYNGFDVLSEAVEWAREEITRRHPNFRFDHVDVASSRYRPDARLSAETFTFPYEDASFDFVYAVSVLTHLLPSAAANYLSEIGRVLRPNGRAAITYFLLDDWSRRVVRKGRAEVGLQPDGDTFWVENEEVPEAAVGLDRGWVAEQHAAARIPIRRIWGGSWCQRHDHLGFQDLTLSLRI